MASKSNTSDVDGGQERGSVFGVARGDAAPALQVQEGVFHQVPALVQVPIIGTLDRAVLSWRNDRVHAMCLDMLDEGVAIVSPVGDQMRGTVFAE